MKVDKNDKEHDPKNLQKKWERTRTRLRAELGEDIFMSWFGRVELDAVNGSIAHLSVPTPFLRKWLKSHYKERLLRCCSAEFKEVQQVEFRVRQPHDSADIAAQKEAYEQEIPSEVIALSTSGTASADVATGYDGFDGSPLDRRLTFDAFVVGTSNRLVHAAAKEVADSVSQMQSRYNPLFIHGSVGHGKTHLLNAIAWQARAHQPQAQVVYLTAEWFMTRFVQALRSRAAVAFKESLRGIDILLIDDMEFLQGPVIQQEFCHALNSLIDSGRQIVVAADRAPSKLERLDARMRSRLAGGLVAEVGPMDLELRQKILEKCVDAEKREDSGFSVPDPVIRFLANRLTEGARELEGAIIRLRAAARHTGEPVTIDRAEFIVRDLMSSSEPKRIKIDDILRIITKHFGVNRSELLSSRRNRSIVRPRQIGMYLAKNLTSRSLPEIGRRFGNRDHTTVLHAIRKIEQLMSDDMSFKEEVDLLKRLLRD
ncbi:MAG: chromosomal replication initiator protein DnaA [Methyloligellaceae bacterium]